jgi:hypothetical protein
VLTAPLIFKRYSSEISKYKLGEEYCNVHSNQTVFEEIFRDFGKALMPLFERLRKPEEEKRSKHYSQREFLQNERKTGWVKCKNRLYKRSSESIYKYSSELGL